MKIPLASFFSTVRPPLSALLIANKVSLFSLRVNQVGLLRAETGMTGPNLVLLGSNVTEDIPLLTLFVYPPKKKAHTQSSIE